jgi:hypothetical protein
LPGRGFGPARADYRGSRGRSIEGRKTKTFDPEIETTTRAEEVLTALSSPVDPNPMNVLPDAAFSIGPRPFSRFRVCGRPRLTIV